MYKTIQTSVLAVLVLGSCSVNQNFISSTNTYTSSKIGDHVESVENIENIESSNGQVSPTHARTVDCRHNVLKLIVPPKIDERAIVSAKTEKELITYLLQHIDKLDKTIVDTNVVIDKNNKHIKKECH